jgi:hypothetical protein
MKKLFCVNSNKGKPYANAYFSNKMEAKALRDELNKETGSNTPYVIGVGIDHWKKLCLNK